MVVSAGVRSSRDKVSVMEEFHAGDKNAVQQPTTNTKNKILAGPALPANNRPTNKLPLTAWMINALVIKRRLSVMSASTPAGSEKRNMGKNTAVCTKAAKNDDPVSCNIVHAAAMICMALPTKYKAPPVNRPRKAGTRSVCQIEVLARAGGGVAFKDTVDIY